MRRKNILVLMISLSLVLLLGSSYAFLRSTVVGNNSYVINVGTLEVTFVDSKTEFLNLSNMYPMTDDEGKEITQELVFQVKNTGNVDSYYDVTLEETSTNPEFKSVIKYIVNKDNAGYNSPKVLESNKYIELGGYLKPNGIVDYRVKVWLAEEADNAYMNKEFKAKVVVNGNQNNYATDAIKKQLVKYSESSKDDFQGGLVAVNTDGELYNETDDSQEIREYRYSGPSVNNYVMFNDETWRIIGVFKDENGEEHIKIVKNEILIGNMLPENFSVSNTTYLIKFSTEQPNSAYWNKTTSETRNKNDWATAGLQYWLNAGSDKETKSASDGYMSYLSKNSKEMIASFKYYLGSFQTYNNEELSPKDSFISERMVDECVDNKGPAENNSKDSVIQNKDCRVWANNAATWIGKIALMYPSDYGYTVQSEYWKTQMTTNSFTNGPSKTSWLNLTSNHNSMEWLITPATYYFYFATRWGSSGELGHSLIDVDYRTVRPTLYLKSNVEITSGTGEENNPYILNQ